MFTPRLACLRDHGLCDARPLGLCFWIRAVGIDGRSVAYEYLSKLESHLIVVEWFVP
jgi:hypothetical protein